MLVVGVSIFFLPLLGLPRSYQSVIMIVGGLVVMILSLRRLRKGYVSELYNGTGEKAEQREG